MAGHGQGIVKLHIVHIVGGILVQVADGLVQGGHILLRSPLAGQAHDAHLDDPAELIERLCAAHLIGAFDPAAGLLNIVCVPQQHLAVAPAVDGAQKFQNSQALSQGAAAHTQHFRQVSL